MKVKVAQSSMTLCDPMDCSLPGSSVHGILQARILDGLPLLSAGDLPNPGTEPRSPALQVDSLPAEPQGKLTIYDKGKKKTGNPTMEGGPRAGKLFPVDT